MLIITWFLSDCRCDQHGVTIVPIGTKVHNCPVKSVKVLC